MLHLALFYKPIDLWLAFYITMVDDMPLRRPIVCHEWVASTVIMFNSAMIFLGLVL
jgi:hypothetical protein